MKSLYGKFLSFTIGIMMTSVLIAFLAVNTYYHHQLKGENDVKNMEIAESIASYVSTIEGVHLDSYLETLSTAGYKLFLVNEEREVKRFGAPFRDENLPQSAIDQVLSGRPFHGMRDLKTETFMTGFFQTNPLIRSVFRLSMKGQLMRYFFVRISSCCSPRFIFY